jgi:hypothetical protein
MSVSAKLELLEENDHMYLFYVPSKIMWPSDVSWLTDEIIATKDRKLKAEI